MFRFTDGTYGGTHMRIGRRLVAPVVFAAAMIAALPAAAVTPTVSETGLPEEYDGGPFVCFTDPDGPLSGSMSHVIGPGTPPHGDGSLRLYAGVNEATSLETVAAGAPASLTAFTFGVYTPSSPNYTLSIQADAYDTDTDTMYTAYRELSRTGGWTTVNVLTDDTSTYEVFQSPPASDPLDDMTWDEWTAYASAAEGVRLSIFVNTCGESKPAAVYLDGVYIGSDPAYLYDFEESPLAAATISASKSKVVYGGTVTLKSTLTGDASPVSNASMQLWAKQASWSSYRHVADATTNDNGVASKTVTPKMNTTYQWRFVGDLERQPANSGTRAVGVARKLTIKAADTTLRKTQELKVSGTEKPAKAGSIVSVWRDGARTVKIGSATVHKDGTWSLSADIPKGTFAVFAKSPADARFLAGRSRSITVTSA
jgi:hypothetical protein